MFGLGTIINISAIVAGGLLGLVSGKFMKEGSQDTIIKATGVCTLFIGISGALSKMLTLTGALQTAGTAALNGAAGAGGAVGVAGAASASGTVSASGAAGAAALLPGAVSISTQGIMMMIVSIVLGAVFGEMIDLDRRIEEFGVWLREKTGNAGDKQFVNAFVTASLTVCIGAMAIVGAIQDGIYGDYTTLAAKSVLDFIIILVMTSSLGKGCIFAAIPVGIVQGSMTLLARLIQPLMTAHALSNISLVGSILIFCVGLNLIWPRTIKVANLLPALIIAVGCAFAG